MIVASYPGSIKPVDERPARIDPTATAYLAQAGDDALRAEWLSDYTLTNYNNTPGDDTRRH